MSANEQNVKSKIERNNQIKSLTYKKIFSWVLYFTTLATIAGAAYKPYFLLATIATTLGLTIMNQRIGDELQIALEKSNNEVNQNLLDQIFPPLPDAGLDLIEFNRTPPGGPETYGEHLVPANAESPEAQTQQVIVIHSTSFTRAQPYLNNNNNNKDTKTNDKKFTP